MDQPSIDAGDHRQALDAMARINFVSASSLILWPPVRDLCRERRKALDNRPVRLLDIASGGGDVPVRMWWRARRMGLALEVAGCDVSPVAIEHARRLAARREAAVEFFQLDVLADRIPDGYDVITSSLFLHHLSEEQAVLALGKMRAAVGRLALVNDLSRGRLGWWAAYFGSRVLTRSPMVHVDALLSVEGAFTPEEALAVAHKAGWVGATVERKFPFRYLLAWRRP
ncbi:MAG TPA: methyltransferase domain-containing protein [Gemmataceae bacterium]|nr:methyltransferase domain-containing protein [Gemmataceae bacterium]